MEHDDEKKKLTWKHGCRQGRGMLDESVAEAHWAVDASQQGRRYPRK